ncbi:MAG: RsmB/NOP family class I SAM-dependent RNA methyltransferase [Anaerolineae bacterium]|nr:RsmB/NOP family class I SAM-dependent RNA methyltransferase [Anaerolineae bacterium]
MLPSLFLQRMAGWLGPEFGPFLEALTASPTVGLRVNTLKISPQDFATRSPFPLEPVPWCPEGFVVTDREARPGTHPYHEAGLYYLQDPSAMAAGVLLDPQPGEWVLDLCAAPGGKTTHLAARMGNEGVLVANEIHPRRVLALAKNLDRLGVTCALVLNESPGRLAARWEGLFDRVLVDAPCSGEGMFMREPDAVRYWSPKAVEGCARRQRAILEDAARLVRPGGLLLYATCTFAPEENEGVVNRFLRAHPEFDLADAAVHPLFDRGRPEWVDDGDSRLKRAVRLWPHRGPGHGHFYALLRRADGPPPDRPRFYSGPRPPGRVRALFEAFWRENLTVSPPEEGLLLQGDLLYQALLPPDLWEGLRVFRPGWPLGTVNREFRPTLALAMGTKPESVRSVHRLAADDPAVAAFLRGETIPASVSGWTLVTVEEFPLGWGRPARGGLRRA